jgi:hypothetical protein
MMEDDPKPESRLLNSAVRPEVNTPPLARLAKLITPAGRNLRWIIRALTHVSTYAYGIEKIISADSTRRAGMVR